MRTRYALPRYRHDVLPETRAKVRKTVEDRLRAHLRAAMAENGFGVSAMAREIDEDKGALSNMLRNDGRAPSLFVVYQLHAVFGAKLEDLFGKDPAPEFWRDGPPAIRDRQYPLRRGEAAPPPSDASREAAHPGKHRRNAGGGT